MWLQHANAGEELQQVLYDGIPIIQSSICFILLMAANRIYTI